jgi:hypothetical protein
LAFTEEQSIAKLMAINRRIIVHFTQSCVIRGAVIECRVLPKRCLDDFAGNLWALVVIELLSHLKGQSTLWLMN